MAGRLPCSDGVDVRISYSLYRRFRKPPTLNRLLFGVAAGHRGESYVMIMTQSLSILLSPKETVVCTTVVALHSGYSATCILIEPQRAHSPRNVLSEVRSLFAYDIAKKPTDTKLFLINTPW